MQHNTPNITIATIVHGSLHATSNVSSLRGVLTSNVPPILLDCHILFFFDDLNKMDVVHIPPIAEASQTKFNPVFSVYFRILLQQLQTLQQQVFDNTNTIDHKHEEFVNMVNKHKGPSYNKKKITLKEELVCNGEHISDVVCNKHVRVDDSQINEKLSKDTMFVLNNDLYDNIANHSKEHCPVFNSFMPTSTCKFIEVLQKGCLYDVVDNASDKVKLVHAQETTKHGRTKIRLEVLQTFTDSRKRWYPRAVNKEELVPLENKSNKTFIDVHNVVRFRGPCILGREVGRLNLRNNVRRCGFRGDVLVPFKNDNKHLRGLYDPENKKETMTLYDIEEQLFPADDLLCKHLKCADSPNRVVQLEIKEDFEVVLTESQNEQHFLQFKNANNIVTSSLFHNYRIASEYQLPATDIRCGLSAYMKGHLGLSQILTSVELETETKGAKKANSADLKGEPEVNANTLYYRSIQKNEPNDPVDGFAMMQYAIDNRYNGLLTVQRWLQYTTRKQDLVVKKNNVFRVFKHNNLHCGGTPYGLVMTGTGEQQDIVGTIDVHCVSCVQELQPRWVVQALTHKELYCQDKNNDQYYCIIVLWSLKESRIFYLDGESGEASFTDQLKMALDAIQSNQQYLWRNLNIDSLTKEVVAIPSVRYRATPQYENDALENETYTYKELKFHCIINNVQFPKITLTDLASSFDDFRKRDLAPESIYMYLLGVSTKNINPLSINSKSECQYRKEYSIMSVSEMIFADTDEFKEWKQKQKNDKKNTLKPLKDGIAHLTKDNVNYIVICKIGEIGEIGNTTTTTQNELTTTSWLSIDKHHFQNFYISASDGRELCLMHNSNTKTEISEHIKAAAKLAISSPGDGYNVKFWCKLFHLVSLLGKKDIQISTSKLKVTDISDSDWGDNVLKNIVDAYKLFVMKPTNETLEWKKEDSAERNVLNMIAMKATTNIHFTSEIVNRAIRNRGITR